MKKMKKSLAILLSMAMVMATGLSVSADAADGGGNSATITVCATEDDATTNVSANLKAVQIVEPNPDHTAETGWKIVDGYLSYFQKYFKTGDGPLDEQTILKGMLHEQDSAKGQSISGFAGLYASVLKDIVADITNGTITGTISGTNGQITVSKAGVYVISATEKDYNYSPMAAYVRFTYGGTGAASGLQNTTVIAKRQTEKTEKEYNTGEEFVAVGDTIHYTVSSVVPYIPETDTNRTYKIVDTLTGAQYALETSDETEKNEKLEVNVYIGKTAITDATQPNFTKYVNVTQPSETTSGTFTLDLSSDIMGSSENPSNLYANQSITITYKTIVTGTKVDNTAEINGGNASGDPSYGSDSTYSVAGQLTITKKDSGTDDDANTLAGARFAIYRTTADNMKEYATIQQGASGNPDVVTGWVAETDSSGNSIDLTQKDDSSNYLYLTSETNAGGTVTVAGLDKDDTSYKFKEVIAPDGYSVNETDADIRWTNENITVDKDTTASAVTGTAEMADTKLNALPSTGGIGTTIFTIGGCLIMVAAAALFFANRKKSMKDPAAKP